MERLWGLLRRHGGKRPPGKPFDVRRAGTGGDLSAGLRRNTFTGMGHGLSADRDPAAQGSRTARVTVHDLEPLSHAAHSPYVAKNVSGHSPPPAILPGVFESSR